MPRHTIDGSIIRIETNALRAEIHTEGYTSGVARGTLLDKKTGAVDQGFGLHIADFLLEPADPASPTPEGQYQYGDGSLVHGDIPKRYVAGPQICTQARKLPYEIVTGDGFLAVVLWYTWRQAYPPAVAGSRWEQTLIFTDDDRHFLSSDRVTTVNASDALLLRIDMPGHIRHTAGDTFEHVYLGYEGAFLTPADFEYDFPPDEKYLYRRSADRSPPEHFVRAYQVRRGGAVGPWLAGITLEPADVHEAWCHQRGYICMIQEIGGRPVSPGDTFGAAYAVGWFDDLDDMRRASDAHRGVSGWRLEPAGDSHRFAGLRQAELTAVERDSPPVDDR